MQHVKLDATLPEVDEESRNAWFHHQQQPIDISSTLEVTVVGICRSVCPLKGIQDRTVNMNLTKSRVSLEYKERRLIFMARTLLSSEKEFQYHTGESHHVDRLQRVPYQDIQHAVTNLPKNFGIMSSRCELTNKRL